MKKYISFLMSLLLASFIPLLICSCSDNSASEGKDGDKLSVVTTIFPYYDFARNLSGECADVKMLLSPGSEPHSYEPSPSDIVAIENCDIFIYNGGESDEWVDKVLGSVDNKNIKVMKMMDYVPLLREQGVRQSDEQDDNASEKHDHGSESEHDHSDEYDEHIWTSVKNAQMLSEEIYNVLVSCDGENESVYTENKDRYISKLQKLDTEIYDVVKNAKRNTVVFGDRFPFLYFATDYSLDCYAVFPGCSSETEPSISAVTHMIDFARDNCVPVVFYLEFSNGKTAQLISEDTGAKTLRFTSCHNITKEEFENGETYISLMEQNKAALKEALN